ncbi:MAG: hypothetical protein Q7S74_04660 [Nanoarchaeota archaeon]|nr:hypothetical protein [Nanoarchaeota archaeon]
MKNETQIRKIENEKDLASTLEKDIKTCERNSIVFLAGHFPILYDTEKRTVEPNLTAWGPFPNYSLEIACQVASKAKDIGKDCRFAFIVDDHTYAPKSKRKRIQKERDRFYKAFSGIDARLHEEQINIMNQYGFDEKNIIKADHGKQGREDCLYISENILIANRKRRLGEKIEKSDCSKAYAEFIETYINKDCQHLIGFIPNVCMGNVCKGVLDKINNIKASHIFCHTDDAFIGKLNSRLTIQELYKEPWGIFYRKD